MVTPILPNHEGVISLMKLNFCQKSAVVRAVILKSSMSMLARKEWGTLGSKYRLSVYRRCLQNKSMKNVSKTQLIHIHCKSSILKSVLSSSSTSTVSRSLIIVMKSLMGIMMKRPLTSKLTIISNNVFYINFFKLGYEVVRIPNVCIGVTI